MNQFEFSLESSDGFRLHGRGWQPEVGMQGVINLVHGLGEHSGRYTHMAEVLTGAGYALITFDLRGHGLTKGKRGHTPSYELLFDDIDALLSESTRRFPGFPYFLYGHSLGGNLVLSYTLHRQPQLAGVIATAPWLRVAFEPPAWKLTLGKLMNVLLPSFTLPSGLDPKDLSHDQNVVDAYINDPLVHDRLSARLGLSAIQHGEWSLQHAGEFSLPLLLMHGGGDRVTSVPASKEFASKVGERCTVKIWDGLYHEIHNEYVKGEVFGFLLNWLEGRTRNWAGRLSEASLP